MQNFGEYHRHDLYGERIAKDILNRLKVSNKQKEEVLFITRHHMLDLKKEMREVKVRRFIVKNYPFIPKLLLAKQADFSACKDDLSLAPTVERWQGIIEKMKEQGAKLIIASFHWGDESATVPNETQVQLAHSAIDNGADLVIGHHPHVLQGIEKYNGKYILYSLGNFCFGGHKNPADKDTMIFQQTFSFTDGSLQPEENIVRIIPCSLSSVTDRNDYRPTPQTGEEAERIVNRLNQFCKDYHISFEKESEGEYVPTVKKASE
jgi:hypothetical protein